MLTPCGPGMCLMGRSLPSKLMASLAKSFMLIISSVPRFSGSWQSDSMMRMEPSTQSSMNMKERVCSPSPHSSNSLVDTTALRQKAAGTFSRPPFHVPAAQNSTAQHSRLRQKGYSKSMWCVVAAARSPRGPYTLWYLAMRVFTGKSLA